MRISLLAAAMMMWMLATPVALAASAARPIASGTPPGGPDEETPIEPLEAQPGGRTQACTASARAALRACRHDVEDEYWLAIGKCLNLADDEERRACLDEAGAARADARALCAEQFNARGEACELLGEDPYDPEIDPDDFLSPEEAAANPHPYFPLVPGTRWVYMDTEAHQEIDVAVVDETIEILGVDCFAVTDVVRDDGVVIEDTVDWFAKDHNGNVWYFGEATKSFEDGELVSLEGSWKAGVAGAKPGIIMQALPQVGEGYRQEFNLGDVEDLAQISSITGTEEVPAASCEGDCVVTKDSTPIEPDQVEEKYYARGVGLMLEVNPDSGERVELVEFHPGGQPAASIRPSGLRVEALPRATPFSSAPEIRFELSKASDVSADVFDSSGRRVRALAHGPHEAGSHSLLWDGKDGENRRVAAGIYFVRVRAGAETSSRKILMLE